MMEQISKILLSVGAVLILFGLLLHLFGKIGFGRLPGDIIYEREGLKIFIPVASSILISVLLTILLNLFFRK